MARVEVGKRVTVKIDGRKFKGRLVGADSYTEPIETTSDGSFTGQSPMSRTWVVGPTTVTLTIELDPQ